MRVQHNWLRLPLGSTLGMGICILIPSGGLKSVTLTQSDLKKGSNLYYQDMMDEWGMDSSEWGLMWMNNILTLIIHPHSSRFG